MSVHLERASTADQRNEPTQVLLSKSVSLLKLLPRSMADSKATMSSKIPPWNPCLTRADSLELLEWLSGHVVAQRFPPSLVVTVYGTLGQWPSKSWSAFCELAGPCKFLLPKSFRIVSPLQEGMLHKAPARHPAPTIFLPRLLQIPLPRSGCYRWLIIFAMMVDHRDTVLWQWWLIFRSLTRCV